MHRSSLLLGTFNISIFLFHSQSVSSTKDAAFQFMGPSHCCGDQHRHRTETKCSFSTSNTSLSFQCMAVFIHFSSVMTEFKHISSLVLVILVIVPVFMVLLLLNESSFVYIYLYLQII
mmetsp:Transcript_33196/g.49479  ORF Transcript_33196/g.49479 Transcript_33196/m.49479 type:complete len:118 (-) Transcript_33196:74-427(-)